MTGTAEVNLEDILEETITGIKLVESTAPEPVPMAVEWAVCSPIWRDNIKNIIHDEDEEMVPLENKE